MTSTKRKSRYTRTQRYKLYTLISVTFLTITLVVGWGTWFSSWVRNDLASTQPTTSAQAPTQNTTNLGIRTRQLGLYPYLTITTTDIDFDSKTPAATSKTTLSWNYDALLLAVMMTVIVMVGARSMRNHMVMLYRLPLPLCDSCGYDLSGVEPKSPRAEAIFCPGCDEPHPLSIRTQ